MGWNYDLWPNGDVYVGEWDENKKHGKGTMTRKTGDSYEGEWKNDKYHGMGVLTDTNGYRYEGLYINMVRKT